MQSPAERLIVCLQVGKLLEGGKINREVRPVYGLVLCGVPTSVVSMQLNCFIRPSSSQIGTALLLSFSELPDSIAFRVARTVSQVASAKMAR